MLEGATQPSLRYKQCCLRNKNGVCLRRGYPVRKQVCSPFELLLRGT